MRRSPSVETARSARTHKRRHDPDQFPMQQMLILACCRICEPIAFMSIFPYIGKMVKSFNVVDESKVALYAGFITSAFTLAEFSTGFLWGRLSDRIGRKPVLLCGMAGTALSVLMFGLAPNYYVALFARALGGLLNGNIGVLQTTVAELATNKDHQPRAYTIMPMVWCIGSIVGPMMGGAFAFPCTNRLLSGIFQTGSIWDKYPVLLPNLVSAFVVFVGLIVGILFLDETHAGKRQQRDRGRELGDRLAAMFRSARSCQGRSPEKQSLLHNNPLAHYNTTDTSRTDIFSDADEPLPVYQSQENSPKLVAQNRPQPVVTPAEPVFEAGKSKVFTKPVILNIICYGILAFHTMTYDSLFPLFLDNTNNGNPKKIENPIKFTGPLEYDQAVVGVIMAFQGMYSLFSNYIIVAPITRRLGSLRLFRMLSSSYFVLYLVTPYLVLLPQNMVLPAIYIVAAWKCTYSTMSYPSNAILLANSAPSKEVLGTINGVAASTASLSRALGPVLSGFLFSFGGSSGYSVLAWWFSGLMTIVGAFISYRITETAQQPILDTCDDITFDEALLDDYSDDERV